MALNQTMVPGSTGRCGNGADFRGNVGRIFRSCSPLLSLRRPRAVTGAQGGVYRFGRDLCPWSWASPPSFPYPPAPLLSRDGRGPQREPWGEESRGKGWGPGVNRVAFREGKEALRQRLVPGSGWSCDHSLPRMSPGAGTLQFLLLCHQSLENSRRWG